MDRRTLEGMRHIEIATGQGTTTSYNMSSVFTKLIKEASKCEMYSSDILYDIEALENDIKNSKHEDIKVRYFGIRDYGVDGVEFIVQREKEYPYISMYMTKTINNHNNIKVTLYKLSERK